MLLYITAEDVLGGEAPGRRGPRPLHTIPSTLAALHDLGLRHHLRPSVMSWWTEGSLEPVPDWKLDRLAIRLALFARERLGLVPGERVAVMGRLGWLWPALDIAAMGFGVLPVGIEHDLGDEAVAAVLAQAEPRAAFATDPATAERLVSLARSGRVGRATVVAEGLPSQDGLLSLAEVVERGGVLDTPERAQSFRAFARQVAPASPALWHAGPEGVARVDHAEAMSHLRPTLTERAAAAGDVAYVDAPRVTARKRLAIAAFVGDGYTTTVLGREGRAEEDVAQLRPHKAVVSEPWLEALVDGRPARRTSWLEARRKRRRLREALGGRLRWIEAQAPAAGGTARTLAAAGVVLDLVGR